MNTHITAQDPIPMGINPEAWLEWEEFRRVYKKKKITTVAARKQFKTLEAFTYPQQQEIVDNSINGDWTGLFPLKNQPAVRQSTYEMLTDTTWADGLVDTQLLEQK